MDTEGIGMASCMLGAGRARKEDRIDHSAGIILKKKYADHVEAGDVLAVLYAADDSLFAAAEEKLLESYRIGDERPEPENMIYARVDREGVKYFQCIR
jgi:pyrimidine-nucleoside phosphorylase